MNDKKVIETYKSLRAVEQAQPDPSVQIAARNDLIAMINHALENPNPCAQPETRNYEQIVSDIQNAQIKSEARKELELMLVGIADRLSHRKTVLPVSNNASQAEQANEPLPLHERIKFLRERLS